jgi:hypothetical protein
MIGASATRWHPISSLSSNDDRSAGCRLASIDMLCDGSVYEPVLHQADRIASSNEPDMNSTILRAPECTLDRTPASAVCRPLSNAFDALLDTLFSSLEPAVDKAASRRICEPDAMQRKHPYSSFDAPAYRRRGRLIPELDRSSL